MGIYKATIEWKRNGQKFTDGRYSRAHRWRFDGGADVPASSSPQVVPLPMSDASGVDPEEAFVASLSSCHFLTFIYLAAKKGFVVDEYRDEAVGTMGKNAAGRSAITVVTLHPAIRFGGEREPSKAELDALHHAAHEECYIANSVTTDVRCEPVELGV
jgi:organic hydroperoxide reductase OsmC/OhrA